MGECTFNSVHTWRAAQGTRKRGAGNVQCELDWCTSDECGGTMGSGRRWNASITLFCMRLDSLHGLRGPFAIILGRQRFEDQMNDDDDGQERSDQGQQHGWRNIPQKLLNDYTLHNRKDRHQYKRYNKRWSWGIAWQGEGQSM